MSKRGQARKIAPATSLSFPEASPKGGAPPHGVGTTIPAFFVRVEVHPVTHKVQVTGNCPNALTTMHLLTSGLNQMIGHLSAQAAQMEQEVSAMYEAGSAPAEEGDAEAEAGAGAPEEDAAAPVA